MTTRRLKSKSTTTTEDRCRRGRLSPPHLDDAALAQEAEIHEGGEAGVERDASLQVVA